MSEVAPPGQEINSRTLWIQLLAGPVLWSVHFLVSYLLVETLCRTGPSVKILGGSGISFIVIALTALALIATGLFSWRSYRGWRDRHAGRSLRGELSETSHWFEGPADFMYFSGFLLSVLFAATILMVGLPALFLHPC